MNTDFLERIRREVALTVETARETLFAVADRVNRKTQAIKLHWHAATITRQIALAYQHAGSLLCDALPSHLEDSPQTLAMPDRINLQPKLEQISAAVRLLKRDLATVDRRIGEIEAEALLDDLLKFQQDLSSRALLVERLTVGREASVVGRSPEQLQLSPSTHVVAIFRGPALLPHPVTGGLAPGDVVILLGLRADLQKDRPEFTERQRATA